MKKTPMTWQEFHEKAGDFRGKQVVVRIKGMKGGAQAGTILDVRYVRGREAFLIIVEIEGESSSYIVDTDESPEWAKFRSYPFELEGGAIEAHFVNGVMLIEPNASNPEEISLTM